MTKAAAARDCQTGMPESTAVAERAVDGDTILLTTKQRVRIIGLDTLEMNAKDSQDRQWAIEAKNALNQLVKGKSITLLTGRDRTDQYGRLLAHVRLPDGRDVARKLIQQGLGIAVGVGRNTACANANIVLEKKARTQRTGLWTIKGSWRQSTSNTPLRSTRGFHLIRSRITNRTNQGKKTRLTLANGLRIRLGRHWPLGTEQTDKLLSEAHNGVVEIRGWIGGRMSTPEMSLHHPANLQIVVQ